MQVSIIVPVFNSERYLKDCLDSLVAQTLNEIEIIAIDDGSTDRSYALLESYHLKYPHKIKVYKNELNHGAGYTRNQGLKYATGKYIGFVDSDDYVSPTMYETMYTSAINHNFPEVITTGLIFVKDNSYLHEPLSPVSNNGRLFSVLHNPQIVLDASPSACNKIFRADTINDKPFLEGRMWEDVAFTFAKMFNANNVLTLNSPDYFYRRNNEGISGKGLSLNPNLLDIFEVADQIAIETKNSGRYPIVENEVRFLQIITCLQRVVEILNWPLAEDTKLHLAQTMCEIIKEKYGDWNLYPKEVISSRIGFLELEKINALTSQVPYISNLDVSILETELKSILK